MKVVADHVFRTYDIRGLVDVDFDADWAECLGRACGAFFLEQGQTRCVVGRDCRESSPSYSRALIQGLLSTGVSVVDVGMVPTPFVYFAVKHLNCPAGVMVTASHNPSEYNGFKIWSGESTLHSGGITQLRERMLADNAPKGRGLGSELNILPAYIEAVTSRITLARPLKVVVDGGNGAGGEYCAAMLRALGAEVIPIFCEPDGRFPNHHPDPVVEANMGALQRAVREHGADAGIGLDGDADRLGVVDEKGRLMFGDELLALYARDVLSRLPGAVVIGDVKCSQRLFDDIARHGGQPEMTATGHSLIKSKILELKAPLAGEMSGHMFFGEGWYGFDDALFGAARLLRILSGTGKPFSSLLGWPPSHVTPELHLPCPESAKKPVIDRARDYFGSRYPSIQIDGIRLTFPDGWALVRASNTQPVLVLRFEDASAERLAELRELVEKPLSGWIRECSEGAA